MNFCFIAAKEISIQGLCGVLNSNKTFKRTLRLEKIFLEGSIQGYAPGCMSVQEEAGAEPQSGTREVCVGNIV